MNFLHKMLIIGCVCLPTIFSASLHAMELTAKIPADLSKQVTKEDLLALITKCQSDESVIGIAQEALDRIYESKPRYVQTEGNTTKYGWTFPCNPEILADVMTYSADKKVLEIAAASGENSLCIGLAGAEEVVINEFEPREVEDFKKLLMRLPEALQEKFHTVPGDCLEVFEDDKYTGYFDVIVARNIFHFFLGEKKEQFIALVSRLLKRGGRLILTVNSAERICGTLDKKTKKKSKEAFVFMSRTPNLRLPDRNVALMAPEYTPVMQIKGINPLDYFWDVAIKFTAEGVLTRDGINNVSQGYQDKMITFAKQLLADNNLSDLIRDNVKIASHTAHNVAYRRHTLQQAFAKSSLKAVQYFYTDALGHITAAEDQGDMLTCIFEQQEIPKATVKTQGQKGPSKVLKKAEALFTCASCAKSANNLLQCSSCKNVYYCNGECQKKHWPLHKPACKKATPQNK